MGYTPSMSPKEIRELDASRGEKFDDPNDTYMGDDHPKEKKPWLTKTPVNKGTGEENMTGTDILTKFSKSCDGHEDDDDAADKNPFEELKKFGKGDMPDDDAEDLKKIALPQGMAMSVKSDGTDIFDLGDKDLDIGDAKKALNSRSMHIPRPPGGYDRFDINRSVSTVTTRGHSKLKGPNGVAPLVGETLRNAEDDAILRTSSGEETFKSCNSHGLVHRVSTGCVMCASIMSKSNSCDGCGEEMFKQEGGSFGCKACS